jgi:tRNA pseudouridine55 synthase
MDFINGETLLVDKPLGWTSFNVVSKLRWEIKQQIGVKKIKVGHAGTLDPLASGLLVICTGKNTKKITSFINDNKTYTGTLLLGKTTPSFDLETDFNETYPIEHITAELIETTRHQFLGKIEQTPPIFSAKQIDGKRAYDLARSGETPEMKAVSIEIHNIILNTNRFPEIDFEITCSKGTYIRSFANDFGKALKSGATLIGLRRTKSGIHSIENAKTIEDWIQQIQA